MSLTQDPRGPNLHVGVEVTIGEGVEFGANVVVHDGCSIGAGTLVGDNAVLGKRPALGGSSTAKRGPLPGLAIGANCTVSTGAIVFAGTTLADNVIVGDLAVVRERVTIGRNSVVGRGATVENDTSIGARVRIQAEAYVTAYCELEDDVFIAPCVVTTNDNFMGRTEKRRELMKGAVVRRGARIGGAAILLPGVEIGEDAFVGAGAIVLRDVPARTVVVGQPARVLREVAPDELLGACRRALLSDDPVQAVGAPATPCRDLHEVPVVHGRRVADAQGAVRPGRADALERTLRRPREVRAVGREDLDVEAEVATQRQGLGTQGERLARVEVDPVDITPVIAEVGDCVDRPVEHREGLRLLGDVVRLVGVRRRQAAGRTIGELHRRRDVEQPEAREAVAPDAGVVAEATGGVLEDPDDLRRRELGVARQQHGCRRADMRGGERRAHHGAVGLDHAPGGRVER